MNRDLKNEIPKEGVWSEYKFDKEMQNSLRADRSIFKFSGLNQPISIWFLSTIAIGLMTFSYTNYSSCRINFDNDRERLSKIIVEANYRKDRIENMFPKKFKDENDLETAKRTIDPTNNFAISAFKGIYTIEIQSELANISKKWNLKDETWKGQKANFIPIDLVQKQVDAIYAVEFFTRFYGYKPSGPNADENEIIQRYVNELKGQSGMTSDYWKAGWVSPPICIQRAIWPN